LLNCVIGITNWATDWTTKETWLLCQQVQETFVFCKALRQVLDPTLHPIRLVPGTDHSPLSSSDVNNALPMCLMSYTGTILSLIYPSTIEKGTSE